VEGGQASAGALLSSNPMSGGTKDREMGGSEVWREVMASSSARRKEVASLNPVQSARGRSDLAVAELASSRERDHQLDASHGRAVLSSRKPRQRQKRRGAIV
jgi:hypothetical protein